MNGGDGGDIIQIVRASNDNRNADFVLLHRDGTLSRGVLGFVDNVSVLEIFPITLNFKG